MEFPNDPNQTHHFRGGIRIRTDQPLGTQAERARAERFHWKPLKVLGADGKWPAFKGTIPWDAVGEIVFVAVFFSVEKKTKIRGILDGKFWVVWSFVLWR